MTNETTQVKFTIEADVVAEFKSRCANESVSMTSVVREWMKTRLPARETKAVTLDRSYRRKAVNEIIGLLKNIMESETAYRDNIPEQFTQRYEAADHACDMLEEAIASLEDAF